MLKERLQNAMTMTVLMGLTWSFGFLMIGHTTFIFQLLFCLFNSFQGLLVFVLFCWRQEDVRKVLTPHCISFKRKGKEVIGTKADYDVTSTMTGHHSAVIVSTETRKNVTSTGSTSSTALLSPTRTKGNNNLKDSESFVWSSNSWRKLNILYHTRHQQNRSCPWLLRYPKTAANSIPESIIHGAPTQYRDVNRLNV